jgi:hypothetical protein
MSDFDPEDMSLPMAISVLGIAGYILAVMMLLILPPASVVIAVISSGLFILAGGVKLYQFI